MMEPDVLAFAQRVGAAFHRMENAEIRALDAEYERNVDRKLLAFADVAKARCEIRQLLATTYTNPHDVLKEIA